ncbi:hypothetical protein MaudCBS49596_004939 [Microsporum audouinii]
MQPKTSFRRVQQFTPEYSTSVFTQYESTRTGMRVVTIDRKGPKIEGHFVLATEIHDDSGAPHTLEHLCFEGSRNYKFKGGLSNLANRLYSEVNAWTSVDCTAYTIETAGWEGFALLLPVYLEHIIVPTLSDASCYTEVYHIDGTGHDAGVVYSEMQATQNDINNLVDLRCRQLLYPQGVGFRYETQGRMESLRLLTADRIREFHRKLYQPKNLCLIISGDIDNENLLYVLDKFEDTIMDVIPSPDEPFNRPWIDSLQVSPLEVTTIEKVEFPEEDESFGEIDIRFLGPDFRDQVQASALRVVLLYLAGSSASLLRNTLVEKERVAADISYDTEERPRTEISFNISSVATEQLEAVERRFFEILKDAMEKEIDLNYMQACIQRHQRTWKFVTETSSTPFTEAVITDFLFGERDGSTLEKIGTLEAYKVLETWTDTEWRSYIKKWISDAHHVSILAVPSVKLATKLMEDEHKRIEERKFELGTEGLKRLAEALEKAKAENDQETSTGLLSRVVIPDVNSIHFIQTTTAKSGSALKSGHPDNRIQKLIDSDGSELPLFIHFEHIPSNFVHLTLMISTADVPCHLLPLLSIYTKSFFSLPIKRGEDVLSFEKVIVELEKDTVEYCMCPSDSNPESLSIILRAEVDRYQAIIKWLKELIWSSIFEVDRLVAITAKLLAGLSEEKRCGESMVEAIGLMIHLGNKSISRAQTALVKAQYLRRVKKLLAFKPEEIVSSMEEIRSALFRPENFRVLVVADMEKLTNPAASWSTLIGDLDTSNELAPVAKVAERLCDAGRHPGRHAYVVPMKTVDSSFAESSSRGLCTYDDPKLPALMVAIAYMNVEGGPLWIALRGSGLAYSYCLRSNIDSGLVHFMVHESPNAHKAFEAAKKAVEDRLSESVKIDPVMVLEGAISYLVSSFATDKQTYYDAAYDSFIKDVIFDVPSDYNEALLKKIRAVDLDQVKEALRDIILPLFTPGKADLFVTCAPTLEDIIYKGFTSSGFKPEVRSLRDFEDDYGMKLIDGDNQGYSGYKEDEESEDYDEHDDEHDDDEEDDDEEDEDDEDEDDEE